jgi:hypothetical protein
MTVRVIIENQQKTKKDIKTDFAEIIKDSIAAIWNELVDATPVKTGNARASWQIVKLGGVGDFLPYGPKYPRPSLDMPSVNANDFKIEIINTAAHLTELNYGNLTRPPTLFVETALERASRKVI